MIYSTFALPFVFDQDVLTVEKEYMKLLDLAMADIRYAIVEQLIG